ncbi:MAG: hypothetical protein GY866_21945 [Proteobacteria bacterium]|nr:hypothetical protein [Pseudomonadota bacterium]
MLSHCPIPTVAVRPMPIGDGKKIAKEAEKMPGVKRLHQESDNSGKSPYTYGHHFGGGILAGWLGIKVFCVPLCTELHEGAEELRKLQNKPAPVVEGREKVGVTTLMALMAVETAVGLGTDALLVLDTYSRVSPSEDVRRCRRTAVAAFGHPGEKQRGRVRRPASQNECGNGRFPGDQYFPGCCSYS